MILLKKALRSIWRAKKSYFACILLLGIGIALFVAFNQMTGNLSAAINSLYDSQRFAHGFASVSSIPLSSVDRLAAMSGVDRMDATIAYDSRVEKQDSTKIITLRLISFQDGDIGRLNNFNITQGSEPTGDGLLLSDAFAKANGYNIGDSISLIIEGNTAAFQITGLVQSPEYIYALQDAGQFRADSSLFGYAYLPHAELATLTGLEATNLAFTLEDSDSYSNLEPQLEESLTQYGLKYLIEREDQPSNAMLQQEIRGLGEMASAIPMVFIVMAIIILYIMLKRIIEQERGQIGTLKALGFSDASIILHYMGYGGITGLAGGLFGLGLSLPISNYITDMYLDIFSLPSVDTPMQMKYVASGLALALAAGLLSAFFGARSTLALSPSEAMRAAAPHGNIKKDITSRIPFSRYIFSSYGIMGIRNISRNKFRSAFIVLGVSFSFALISYMVSYGEMFDTMMLKQFSKVELYNLKISFLDATGHTSALEAAYALPEIKSAETLFELPVEASNDNLKYSFLLTGMQQDSTLYRIYDSSSDSSVPLRKGGVILSSAIAKHLDAKPGDVLAITCSHTGKREYSLPVIEVIEANLGAGAYIEQQTLWDIVGLEPTVNNLILDAGNPAEVKSSLHGADNVGAITDQQESKAVYEEMLSSYSSMITMLQLAGIGIAYIIITNTASISLSERKREYATMLVLGMHPHEISRALSFEYWVLSLLAIQPGILLTQLVKNMLAESITNDSFSMPLTTAPSSFIIAALLCFLAVLLSNWNARRKIAHFDMVEVLKERE